MKLTTLNLQGFHDWEARQPAIEDYLSSVQPDIVLFQEVVYLPQIDSHNQVQLLNQQLKYPYEHSVVTRLQKGVEYDVYREGLAVLSRHPITKSESLVLTQAAGDEHQRIIQLVDVAIGGTALKIANVHFSLSEPGTNYAAAHIQETFELLEKRGEPRMIAGDFNMSEMEDVVESWRGNYTALTDVAPYISQYNAIGEAGVLHDRWPDQVWVPTTHQFDGAAEVSTVALSDHCAVTATIVTQR